MLHNKKLVINTEKKFSQEILSKIASLEEKIFKNPKSYEELEKQLKTKFNILILTVTYNKDLIAYKIGFERSQRVYYSWIGGVDPNFRKQGIAKELMNIQHEEVKNLKYQVVQTVTSNQFKSMIVLNIKSGFDITGTYQSVGETNLKIIMEKSLASF